MPRKRKKISRRAFIKAAAAVVASGSLKGCAPPKPRSNAAMEAFRKRKYTKWQKTTAGKRCIKLVKRASLHAGVSQAYVLDRVRSLGVSKSNLSRILRESTKARKALSSLDRSTEQNKMAWNKFESKIKLLNTDYCIVRVLIDADLARATFSDLPEAELPPSGSELQAAVRGRKSFAVKKHGRFDSEIESRINPAHLPKNVPAKSKVGVSRVRTAASRSASVNKSRTLIEHLEDWAGTRKKKARRTLIEHLEDWAEEGGRLRKKRGSSAKD